MAEDFTKEDLSILEAAKTFAKANRRALARQFTDRTRYPSEAAPVSVFMAGSPGAGKTEASLELLASPETGGQQIIRVDPDELRQLLPGYTGENSHLFQPAVSIIVEKILDLALDADQSFLLDGTCSNLEKARANIKRSLGRDRAVQILYVYQEPEEAWRVVRAREQLEGRRVPLEDFVTQYFASRKTVNALKAEFGKLVKVDLLFKPNGDPGRRLYQAGIDLIDNHVPEKYDPDGLRKLIQSS